MVTLTIKYDIEVLTKYVYCTVFAVPKCPPAVVPGNCTIDNADSTMAAVVFFNCSYGNITIILKKSSLFSQ